MKLPALTRAYQNHHLDSTRWELYQPRPDDIIITTAYKAGSRIRNSEKAGRKI